MKLLRYGPMGMEKPGMLDNAGNIRDLSAVISDITGATVSPEGLDLLRALDPESLPLVEGKPRLGPCIGAVGNLISIGLNYADHAEESGVPTPTEPVVFSKATSSISGPDDDIILPEGSQKTDWEAELAFVISRRAYRVGLDEALDYVAGYCICHDVSERSFQLEHGGQWIKGKSCPSFGPLGPWLVSADEVADVQNLDIWLDHNGTRRQQGTTSKMIFPVAEIIAYVSRFFCLLPGDVITTGTPAGVGMGMTPPAYLRAGDRVELGISGLGQQRQQVRAFG
ncbi:fumarylacetoacetate hydrolase family protein [Paracoccus caeni]|uniref:Fumarylacetoacetate hydrolase family protein n=1 Tax=Paracoccus caeni TaxID=657651 RepID=A0A934SP91_9RHOB|nr:fumarylacetoacetate hydrolase family protein [Paracoccus caeni]MBK4217933.1 fumarylacetoacetate hydrolase family protein [Paracoccus caeni]